MKKIALSVSLACAACAASPEPVLVAPPAPPAPTMAPAAPLAATAAPPEATAVSAPVDPPAFEIEYPFRGIDKIPDGCKEPSVVLTTAPTKKGWDYDWTWTRQAFHANPQFKIVDWPGKPKGPMDVRLDMYEIPAGFALVGVCHDGATCNQIAAMYRGTVPTCNPVLHCGALPIKGTPRRSAIIPKDGQWLPVADDNTVGRCARIGVCMKMKHVPFTGNPGVVCQSTPSKFKTDCAKKASCDEVVACLR